MDESFFNWMFDQLTKKAQTQKVLKIQTRKRSQKGRRKITNYQINMHMQKSSTDQIQIQIDIVMLRGSLSLMFCMKYLRHQSF